MFGFLRQRRASGQRDDDVATGPRAEPDTPARSASGEGPPSISDDAQATLAAIERAHAVVSFSPTGVVLSANQPFLSALGYEAHEVLGQSHAYFVDPAEARSAAYAAFWRELRKGSAQARRFRRRGKDGREVWFEASYNPVLDAAGNVVRVVKVASDVTVHERRRAKLADGALRLGQLAAGLEQLAHALADESARGAEHAAQGAQQADLVVATACEVEVQASTLLQTVDAISKSASAASNVAVQAVQSALLTSHAVVELGKRSDEVGDVVSTVAEVARLTNLLALNATIEAARAGDAGLGFAVVANAVKDLSKQTAASAEDISRRIGAMQSTTMDVAAAIRTICEVIDEVCAHQRRIASAVDEQLTLVSSMAAGAQRNAETGKRIAEGVATVRGTAVATTQLGERVLSMAQALGRLASALHERSAAD